MRYCTRCVMPETAESLTFDEEGVCSACRQIEHKQTAVDWKAKYAEFESLVERVRGGDCAAFDALYERASEGETI